MTDPDTLLETPTERDISPVISKPRKNLSGIAVAIGMVAAGALLFSMLDARRRALSAPSVSSRTAQASALVPPPSPLYIPPEPQAIAWYSAPPPSVPAPVRGAMDSRAIARPPVQAYDLPPPPSFIPTMPLSHQPPQRSAGAPMLMDTSQGSGAAVNQADLAAASRQNEARGASARARAGIIANRSTTVPQGTIIPAVLETALDSSSAGYARALVQQDVRGFDGLRILIPRGSRLIGEYQSNASAGQKRALISWSRLIRPDGGTIALDSPATDPLGKGGIRAKVDSHFFERFSGTILQSALDVGVNLAARSAGGSTVLALPGSFSGSGQAAAPAQIPPTLSVRQGTSVSVFVARDLDFTDIEERQ